ncbi:Ecdysone 20-monooxygenase [Eumeta japonica]|uniref:Ecdysone 20-monooxygenase n=1 Tax=Eumeta variegata TaxID=151549 RepID=A0A4C1VAM3_EUMVA|nr:Ecdysone 20-monooxygenase [Eumeta japonica]
MPHTFIAKISPRPLLDWSGLPTTLAAVVVVLVVSALFVRQQPLPLPGPPPLPLVGTRWLFWSRYKMNKLHEAYEDMLRRYGPVFTEVGVGLKGPRLVSVAERAALEKVLRAPARRPYRPPTEIVQAYRSSRPDRYASTGLVNEWLQAALPRLAIWNWVGGGGGVCGITQVWLAPAGPRIAIGARASFGLVLDAVFFWHCRTYLLPVCRTARAGALFSKAVDQKRINGSMGTYCVSKQDVKQSPVAQGIVHSGGATPLVDVGDIRQGDRWHHLRRNLTTDLTSPQTMQGFLPELNSVCDDFLVLLDQCRGSDGTVNGFDHLTNRMGLECKY